MHSRAWQTSLASALSSRPCGALEVQENSGMVLYGLLLGYYKIYYEDTIINEVL